MFSGVCFRLNLPLGLTIRTTKIEFYLLTLVTSSRKKYNSLVLELKTDVVLLNLAYLVVAKSVVSMRTISNCRKRYRWL